VGQISIKFKSSKVKACSLVLLIQSFVSSYLMIGLFLYAISAVVFIVALKYGPLSMLYPVIATNYIWVVLLSVQFLGESFSIPQWIGLVFITLGVSLIVQ
jgi:uncharacterized membrane protein